ncbi:hypothetical protein CVT24_000045 [Panaeolus cyanescens]|uniref:Uncharacterized protein n=1 Tax=Panaeolus cyanescens TaxID=181874 RepID=A0A409W7E3_9AGAR|nr:hypothetical protein CVT24_000045 [Panaeolus cyanescens]
MTVISITSPPLDPAPVLTQFVPSPSSLRARRRGGGGGDAGDDDDDDDNSSSQCANNVCVICVNQTCATVTSTPGSTPTLHVPVPSQTGSQSVPPMSTPTSTPTATPTASATKSGDLSTSTQLPPEISHRSRVAVGTIVGAVLGSLIALGLIIMMIHKFVARKRKARKRPAGFVASTYFNVGNTGDGDHSRSRSDPEMSQTQSSPLISTAMAAHVASRHSTAPSSAYSSVSPLPVTTASNLPSLPNRSLSASVSASTSSHRRASVSETEASSQWPHEPLMNPYEMPPPAWSVHNPNPASPEIASTTPVGMPVSREVQSSTVGPNVRASTSPVVPADSNLLRSMTAFQKALEAEGEKPYIGDVDTSVAGPSAQSDTKKENQYDPPPQYRD